MSLFLSLLWTLFSVYFIGCQSGCTCKKDNQEACESAGILRYDEDNNIITQCTWNNLRCRNTKWITCKQDPSCLWIKKRTTDDVDSEEEDDDDVNDECETDQDEGEMVLNAKEMRISSSSDANGYGMPVYLFCGAALILMIAGIHRLFKQQQKETILPAYNQHCEYSTF